MNFYHAQQKAKRLSRIAANGIVYVIIDPDCDDQRGYAVATEGDMQTFYAGTRDSSIMSAYQNNREL